MTTFITHRQLLRQRFPQVRGRLSAGWLSKPKLRVVPNSGLIFDRSRVVEPAVMDSSPLASKVTDKPVTTTTVVPSATPISTTTYSAAPRKRSNRVVQSALTLVIALSVLIGGIWAVPHLYYSIFPKETVPVISQDPGTPLGGEFQAGTQATQTAYEPPQDETLPEGKWLVIPRIGVRTELIETANSEEALQKGVWLVPEYGQPGDRSKPMIAAAHRYGWRWWWESDYWKYHSFNLLPDLEPGDTVEVIADQRKWVYEVYAGAEGDEITDYDADLILYTCKFLNSPVRHFRYARLIDPTQNTQASVL